MQATEWMAGKWQETKRRLATYRRFQARGFPFLYHEEHGTGYLVESYSVWRDTLRVRCSTLGYIEGYTTLTPPLWERLRERVERENAHFQRVRALFYRIEDARAASTRGEPRPLAELEALAAEV